MQMASSSYENNAPEEVRLIWHRRDLRLNDNELYSNLISSEKKHVSSVSIFVFDGRYFELASSSSIKSRMGHRYNTMWCGPHAAQAMIEAVTSLRKNIRSIGGELLIRTGDPAIIIPQIAKEIGATEIVYNEEPGSYENETTQKLRQIYQFGYEHGGLQTKLVSKVSYTLYHPDDLPFDSNEWDRLAHPKKKHMKKSNIKKRIMKMDINQVDVSPHRFKGMCRIMGDFRKACRSASGVRQLLESPTCLLKPSGFNAKHLKEREGSIPTLEELMGPLLNDSHNKSIFGLDREIIEFVVQSAIDNRNRKHLHHQDCCGEMTALRRLISFISDGHAEIADRSRADVSNNNSSRFSVHLAMGTLSPRAVYWKAREASECCQWLVSHLEMRDFFLFTAFAAGERLFHLKGLPLSKRQENIHWYGPIDDEENWERWAIGKSQLPIVDAGMMELMSTGYCSNRVRQNVASVLTKDLKIDWRAGAEWFQFLLEDHCVGSNWGNWLYFSGVGPDPKKRHFRTVSQLKRYDVKGEYVKRWLPTLKHEDIETTFRPWDFDVPGFSSPIVDPASQYTWRDLQCLKEKGRLFFVNSESERTSS